MTEYYNQEENISFHTLRFSFFLSKLLKGHDHPVLWMSVLSAQILKLLLQFRGWGWNCCSSLFWWNLLLQVVTIFLCSSISSKNLIWTPLILFVSYSQGKGGVFQGRRLWHNTVPDLNFKQIALSCWSLWIRSTVDLDFVDFGDAEEKSIGEVSHQSIFLDSWYISSLASSKVQTHYNPFRCWVWKLTS